MKTNRLNLKRILNCLVFLILISGFAGVVSAENVSENLTKSVADMEIQAAVEADNVSSSSDLLVAGKGIWIWKIWELDESVSEITDQLQSAGVDWVTIKKRFPPVY